MKIGIVNNNLGNVGSIFSAFRFYGYDVRIVDSRQGLKDSNLIVLSGVGNFKSGMSALKRLKLLDELNREVLVEKKPVLGICLGMQLFSEIGFEHGETKGLGWIKGKVVKMDDSFARLPHIGWDFVKPLDKKLFKGMHYNYFYFMHSYYFIPEDKKLVKAVTKYGGMEIASVLRKDNILGVQFHPEKSQGDGLRFLRNSLKVLI